MRTFPRLALAARHHVLSHRLVLICGGLAVLAGSALYLAWPGPGHQADLAPVAASAIAEGVDTDRAGCEQQAWPYIDHRCRKGAATTGSDVVERREVRIVATSPDAPRTVTTMVPVKRPIPAETTSAMPVESAKVEEVPTPPLPTPEPPQAMPSEAKTNVASNEPSSVKPTTPVENGQSAPALADRAQAPATVAMSMRGAALDNEADTPAAAPVERPGANSEPIVTAKEIKGPTKASRQVERVERKRIADRDAAQVRTAKKAVTSRKQTAQAARPRDAATLIRTYDFADGRRITVYKKLTGAETQRRLSARDLDRPLRENFDAPVARRLSAYLE